MAAPTLSASPAPGVAHALLDRPLVYVTGMGGCGKTTVATALGMAAAASGRRALVCELAGERTLQRAFGIAPDRRGEIHLRPRLWCLSIEPREALAEWLREPPARGVPGGPSRYDVVIVDAPSTGQARALRDLLADDQRTGYVCVALPEELPVREALELERRLPEATGHELDLIVVNGVYPDCFSEDEAEQLETLASRPGAPWALRAALSHHLRARRHSKQLDRLREQSDTPVVTLPHLFGPALGSREYEYEWLGRELMAR